jgi:hypothetical protein
MAPLMDKKEILERQQMSQMFDITGLKKRQRESGKQCVCRNLKFLRLILELSKLKHMTKFSMLTIVQLGFDLTKIRKEKT